MVTRTAVVLFCTVSIGALQLSAAHGQQTAAAPSGPQWSALRIAKWSVAGATAGVALYGLLQNQRADERYEELEEMCAANAELCRARLPDGAYQDAGLESAYQDVRDADRSARTALIAGQIGVAAAVVLFIIDLRNAGSPPNIPYEPRPFDVAPSRDGGLSMRLTVPLTGGP